MCQLKCEIAATWFWNLVFCHSADQLNLPLGCTFCCWWSDVQLCQALPTNLSYEDRNILLKNDTSHVNSKLSAAPAPSTATKSYKGNCIICRRFCRLKIFTEKVSDFLLKAPLAGESHGLWSSFIIHYLCLQHWCFVPWRDAESLFPDSQEDSSTRD